MEIRVLGDFEIAREILLGVTRLFSDPNGNLVTYAPAILLSLFLMWSFLKWALDQEKSPYPAKEFVFGLVFWLIFGGGPVSPKFDVELTSIRESKIQIINDVPFLAAIPSWLASNFFGEIRSVLEDNFSPLHYSTLANDRTPDPLAALIKLYDNGSALLVEPYLAESIAVYMKECYEVEQELDGVSPGMRRTELDTMPIHNGLWAAVKVTYNFLTTTYYSEADKDGSVETCEDAWTKINTMIGSSAFTTKLAQSNEKKGINSVGIAHASNMIYAASVHPTPNPLSIQQGLFLSYMMRDGLSRTTLETFSDRMMFEAQRKRVVEKAGERNMFLQLMIPIITALETFSFFIAPVMMLLSVLGGVGLGLITKYLMLVLFVNLWGFVKIFVDLFTSISVERAFSAANSRDPLVFGAYANTFNEIEALLAVASSMTVAIPMFAMFLLYGGVHSVMGVMRTLGGGSVDGSMVAPSMGTSMNNGTMQMGDTTSTQMVGTGKFATSHSIGSDTGLGTMSVNGATSGTFNQTASTANARVRADATSWQETASKVFSSSNAKGTTVNGGESFDFSTMSANQQMDTIAHRLESSGAVEKGRGGQVAGALMAELQGTAGVKGDFGSAIMGLAARFGVDAKAAAQIKGTWTDEEKKKYSELAAKVQSWSGTDTYTTQGGNTKTYTNMNGHSVSSSIDASASEVLANSQQLAKSMSIASGTEKAIANQIGINTNSAVSLNALDGVTRGKEYENLNEMYKSFTPEQLNRLQELGIGSADELMKQTFSQFGFADSVAKNIQTMDSIVGRGDLSTEQTANDHGIQADAYRFAGGLIDDRHGTGFFAVANAHDEVAKAARGVDATARTVGGPDSSKVPEAEAVSLAAAKQKETVETDRENIPTSATLLNDVIGGEGKPFDANGKPINNVKGNDAATKVEASKKELGDIEGLAESRVGRGMVDFAKGGIERINSAINGIFGPGLLWNKDEDGKVIQSVFSGLGNQSNQLETGWKNLAQFTAPQIQEQFAGGKPTHAAYAMNDTIRSLQGAGGQEIWNKIPDTDEGNRIKAAVTEFELNKSQLSPEAINKMNALSDGRISGALPDITAARLIGNDNAESGPKTNMLHNVNYATEGYIVSNTPELSSNKYIMDMAGAKIGDNQVRDRSAGETGAKRAFAVDEADRIVSAGEYKYENGIFVPGVNRDYTDEDQKRGVREALVRNLDVNTNGKGAAATNSTSELHPLIGSLASSQLGFYADRLEGVGLTQEADKFRHNVSSKTSAAVEAGVITTKELIAEKANIADRIIINDDRAGIAAYIAAESLDNSIISSNTNPVVNHATGSTRTDVTMVGQSEDGRVLFKANGVGAGRTPESSQNDAAKDGAKELGLIAIEDKFMNIAFNRAQNGNNQSVPESFVTDTSAKFTLVGTQDDGSHLYDGGRLGQFTYTEGDTRLIPTEDNHNYAKKDDYSSINVSNSGVIYVK